jgi:hypothetical protein
VGDVKILVGAGLGSAVGFGGPHFQPFHQGVQPNSETLPVPAPRGNEATQPTRTLFHAPS